MEPLSFQVHREDGRAEVRVAGTLDMDGILRLEPVLHDVISSGEVRHITLDLSGLASLDSMAMALLIDTYASAQRNDLELRLRRLRDDARPVLRIVGPDPDPA
jgi:anti-anti-sigma factor